MKLFYVFELFFLLSFNLLAMDVQESIADSHSSYTIQIHRASNADRDWAYQTLFDVEWQEAMQEHLINPWGVYAELSEFKKNISQALNLTPELRKNGLQACEIILRIFPVR